MTRKNNTETKRRKLDPLEDLGLPADTNIALLQALHILTVDGRINQDSRRKLKQVQHLVQLIAPKIKAIAARQNSVSVVDHGAGKSYLGFMLWEWVLKNLQGKNGSNPMQTAMIGIEARAELVEKSQVLAHDMAAHGMSFIHTNAADAATHPALPEMVEVVTALHACNTATDDAIAFALAKNASLIVLVPCCQAEVAALLRQNQKSRADTVRTEALTTVRTEPVEVPDEQAAYRALWQHALHAREFGSHLTNVLRTLWLESAGYTVTVTELVGWEHSMKNELILAEKTAEKIAEKTTENAAQNASKNYTEKQEKARENLQQLLFNTGLSSLAVRYSLA